MGERYIVSTEEQVCQFRWGWRARHCFKGLQLEPGQAAVLARFSEDGVMTILGTKNEAAGDETYGLCKLPLDVEITKVEVED